MSGDTLQAASPRQQSAFFIPSLDGIRALAFLLVFFGHVGMPGIPGGFGVTVFFFLSGYLITTLLRLEVERTGTINFKLFYLRRVLRILPPFYLVLIAAALLTGFGVVEGMVNAAGLRAQMLHYFNYYAIYRGFAGAPSGTGVYWSLAIEEHFYAVFPAIYALLISAKLSGKQQRIVFWGLCGAVFLWRCVLVFYFHAPSNRTYLATDTRFDSLLMGCALAVANNPILDDLNEALRPARPTKALIVGLIISGAMLLCSFVIRGEQFRETFRYTIQICGLYAFFYAAVRFPGWTAFRLFNIRPMRFLGKLSYSLYLVHQVVIALVWAWLPSGGVIRGVLAFAGSLLVSWTVWVCVEQPCARLRKRLEVYQLGAR